MTRVKEKMGKDDDGANMQLISNIIVKWIVTEVKKEKENKRK